ncbi:transglutaminase family protein [Amnibacterium sp. CER49]|uniref:transglutaminase family protein n=1 Tax=Amnibacterium sp. CER49 TaxID=3039161 RepID=UPI002446D49B|nr:transglutaminase family protein [Amnibacterium sp. CER49]MDH2444833.1 transglutaminase family protein [Amnibacterium sp. CER49]
MTRLHIRHLTGYRYGGEVTASYNEARMLPATDAEQLVLAAHLQIEPVSSSHAYVDYWGTRVNSFEILTPHRELSLTATSTVEIRRPRQEGHDCDWEQVRRAADVSVPVVEQLQQTTLTEPPVDVAVLAHEAAGDSVPCVAARLVCETIGDRMTYLPGVTGVTSTAADAWREGRGVCQDITHLALGALRSVGLPSRYVSGYLHPDPAAPLGVPTRGESHAWVEWYCHGGWHGYDPTNGIPVGDRHVLVGRGRDYADVAPLRGVYAGPFGSELFVEVEITREG